MWKNRYHTSIPDLKAAYANKADGYALEDALLHPEFAQLDEFLAESDNPSFKILHPVLIKGYKMPSLKFSKKKLDLIGFDVETNAETGEPRLLGFWTPDYDADSKPLATGRYDYMYRPTLPRFFDFVKSICETQKGASLIAWGQLDIQAVIRLFNPTEDERKQISRGLSARVVHGEMKGNPSVMRVMNEKKNTRFYISHYIAGRSLKLAYLENDYEHSLWIFNGSQFYQGRIAASAKGLGLPWKDYPQDTHIVNWTKYQTISAYKTLVLKSNEQDARTVYLLADRLQDTFYATFQAYPTLLVSTGSLTDAAVSAMLRDSREEYQSNSFKWIAENIWKPNGVPENVIETLQLYASLSYSAGYIDQYGMGYWPEVFSADISSAYPDKIRRLPDLRESVIFPQQSDSLEYDVQNLTAKGYEVESAFIIGEVTVPQSLKYHPITIKTYTQENYRPQGTFHAGYGLDSRRYCAKHGATFANEKWVILALKKRVLAPIANVSTRLGTMRDELRKQLKAETDSDRKVLLDGQQFLVKVVDNSIYGKTVMTTEVVENIDGTPRVVGYVAGDRFNLIYGSLITERTRIQIAELCTSLELNGSRPIMTMTDAVYWSGSIEHIPPEVVALQKTAGLFEPAERFTEFYLIKTGQYEYAQVSKGVSTYHYKMRGFHVDYDKLDGKDSFYRKLLKTELSNTPHNTRADKISLRITTRRLVTIGSCDLERLGAIVESETHMRPFTLGSKQAVSYVARWWETLDDHVWFDIPQVEEDSTGKVEKNLFLNEAFRDNMKLAGDIRPDRQKREGHNRANRRYARKPDTRKRLLEKQLTLLDEGVLI